MVKKAKLWLDLKERFDQLSSSIILGPIVPPQMPIEPLNAATYPPPHSKLVWRLWMERNANSVFFIILSISKDQAKK